MIYRAIDIEWKSYHRTLEHWDGKWINTSNMNHASIIEVKDVCRNRGPSKHVLILVLFPLFLLSNQWPHVISISSPERTTCSSHSAHPTSGPLHSSDLFISSLCNWQLMLTSLLISKSNFLLSDLFFYPTFKRVVPEEWAPVLSQCLQNFAIMNTLLGSHWSLCFSFCCLLISPGFLQDMQLQSNLDLAKRNPCHTCAS